MIQVGSMQSNDLLIEYSETRRGFQLINTVRVLDDRFVLEAVERILQQLGIATGHVKVYFCGANEWVIQARGYALIELLEAGGLGDGR